MKQWWASLQARERRTLLFGGIALLVMAFVFLIWLPGHRGAEDLRQQLAEERATLAWMQDASRQVRALSGGAQGAPAATDGRSLFSLVETTARDAGLSGKLRVESSGDRQVRISVDAAPFDNLVGWLATLRQQHGIEAGVAGFRDAGQAGLVDAQLVLEGGQ